MVAPSAGHGDNDAPGAVPGASLVWFISRRLRPC